MSSLMQPATREQARWLICLELQDIHAAHREVLENSRQLLAHARRMGWPVVHVHLRPLHGGGRLGPFAGCEPLPSEPVFFRDGAPSTLDHPFWRLARSAEGSEAMLCGVVSDPWSTRSVDVIPRLGIQLTPVRGALGGSLAGEVLRKFRNSTLGLATSAPDRWLLEAANAP